MEDNKIRVGITQGDINGVGYEVILKTFSDPVMLELCTPIIYGSPKVAAYHRKSLDLPTNFSIAIFSCGQHVVSYPKACILLQFSNRFRDRRSR